MLLYYILYVNLDGKSEKTCYGMYMWIFEALVNKF